MYTLVENIDEIPLKISARPGIAFEGKLPLQLVREWENRYKSDPRALSAAPAGSFIRQPITVNAPGGRQSLLAQPLLSLVPKEVARRCRSGAHHATW